MKWFFLCLAVLTCLTMIYSAPSITLDNLSAPSSFAGVDLGSGGALPAGTYYYKVIAIKSGASLPTSPNYVRSAPSQEIQVNVSSSNSRVALTWNAVTGAHGYIIWRTIVQGEYCHNYNYTGSPCFYGTALRNNWNQYTSRNTSYVDDYDCDGNCDQLSGYQGIDSFMYLDFEVPQFLWSGGNATEPSSMKYLYSWSINNSYGYITRSGDEVSGYYYDIKARIYNSGTGYWKESRTPDTWLLWGGFYSNFANTYIVWGINNTGTLESLYCPDVTIVGHYGYYAFATNQFRGNTYMYGCDIKGRSYLWVNYQAQTDGANDPYTGQLGVQNLIFTGNYYVKDTKITGAFYQNQFFGGGDCNVIDSLLQAGSRTFALGTGDLTTCTFDGVDVRDEGQGINAEHKKAWLKNVKVRTNGYDVFLGYGDTYVNFTNPDFNINQIYYYRPASVAPGAQFSIFYTIDAFKIRNETNQSAVDSTILIYNNRNELIYNQTTDSNGKTGEAELWALYSKGNSTTADHYVQPSELYYKTPFQVYIYQDSTLKYTEELNLTARMPLFTAQFQTGGEDNFAIGYILGRNSKSICLIRLCVNNY